ncbi:hypothetical protein [Cryptosporangium sp. NPDC048952]|uniref:hypothetical protein n=1 Tax=Cryptosporangium sp. NPDC048952 TaxID=3363961 RepID=UPI0037225236
MKISPQLSYEAIEVKRLAATVPSLSAVAASDPLRGRAIRAGLYAVSWSLVFVRHTRPLEYRRGHPWCASAVERLVPGCVDRFEDDLEAVVDYTMRYAGGPIGNLEGFIVRKLPYATADGNRHRRGARGAIQRPRLPAWLGTRLGGDPWLCDLALYIIDWVGGAEAVGLDPWPTPAWAERRMWRLGDMRPDPAATAADIERVLQAMRARANWYEAHIAGPLDRRDVRAVALSPDQLMASLADRVAEPSHEDDLTQRAALALQRLGAHRAAVGGAEDAVDGGFVSAVADTVDALFGSAAEVPTEAADWITEQLRDPFYRRRIAGQARQILRDNGTHGMSWKDAG